MILRQKCQQLQHVTVIIVLALVTLYSATKNRNDPISVVSRKEAKGSTILTVMYHCCMWLSPALLHLPLLMETWLQMEFLTQNVL
jgi:hypothetical protein